MAGGHISYNPAVRFANLRTFAGPFAAWLRPARALPSPYSYAWIGVSQLERRAAAGVVLTASSNFADLGLADSLLRAIAETGYTAPTPIQAQAIPQVLKGGDLLAAAQTGTGKTAGFTLPILHLLSQISPPSASRAARAA